MGSGRMKIELGAPTDACSEGTAELLITKTKKWSTEKYNSCDIDGVYAP